MSKSASHGVRKRTRVLHSSQGVTKTVTSPILGNPGGTTQRTYVCQVLGKQETYSRDNPEYHLLRILADRERRGEKVAASEFRKRRDAGSSFLTISNHYEHTHPYVRVAAVRGATTYSYQGPQFARSSSVDDDSTYWPVLPSLSLIDFELRAMGATAISRTIPTNPNANAAQFLGELREGLPHVPGVPPRAHGYRPRTSPRRSARKSTRKAADEYLNYEFGIAPILSDLGAFYQSYRRAETIIEQLRRDSGKVIRRRYAFPPLITTETTLVSDSAAVTPALNTYLYAVDGGTGKLERTRQTTRHVTFSGAYTYHYEEGENLWSRVRQREQQIARLFGLRVTPELFWELTPWSWFADWITNLGDVFHNVSMFANDGLVMCWGYVMGTYTIRDTYTLSGIRYADGTSRTFSQTFETTLKRRLKATPYGFGLDPAGFTPRQWAILAALGISRSGIGDDPVKR